MHHFYANMKQVATSKCVIPGDPVPYEVGDKRTVHVQDATILSINSCEEANCLAKELAQIRADRALTCLKQCYNVVCIEGFDAENIGPPFYINISTVYGIVNFNPSPSAYYTFTVKQACNETQGLEIIGYDEEGTEWSIELLQLVAGNSVQLTGEQLAENGVVVLSLKYQGINLITSKNDPFIGQFFVPGINCDYIGTDLVQGQAYGCDRLPCGIGFFYTS